MKLFAKCKTLKNQTPRHRRDQTERQRLAVETMEGRCLLSGLSVGSVAAEVPPISGLVDHSVAEVHTVASFIDPRTLFMGRHPNHNETLIRVAGKKRRVTRDRR